MWENWVFVFLNLRKHIYRIQKTWCNFGSGSLFLSAWDSFNSRNTRCPGWSAIVADPIKSLALELWDAGRDGDIEWTKESNYISKSLPRHFHHCEVGDRHVNICDLHKSVTTNSFTFGCRVSPGKVLAPFAIDCISPRLTWLWNKRLHGHLHLHQHLVHLDLQCAAPIVSNETKAVGFQMPKPKNWNSSHLGVCVMTHHGISWYIFASLHFSDCELLIKLCRKNTPIFTFHLHKLHKFKTCKDIQSSRYHDFKAFRKLHIQGTNLQGHLPLMGFSCSLCCQGNCCVDLARASKSFSIFSVFWSSLLWRNKQKAPKRLNGCCGTHLLAFLVQES